MCSESAVQSVADIIGIVGVRCQAEERGFGAAKPFLNDFECYKSIPFSCVSVSVGQLMNIRKEESASSEQKQVVRSVH